MCFRKAWQSSGVQITSTATCMLVDPELFHLLLILLLLPGMIDIANSVARMHFMTQDESDHRWLHSSCSLWYSCLHELSASSMVHASLDTTPSLSCPLPPEAQGPDNGNEELSKILWRWDFDLIDSSRLMQYASRDLS